MLISSIRVNFCIAEFFDGGNIDFIEKFDGENIDGQYLILGHLY